MAKRKLSIGVDLGGTNVRAGLVGDERILSLHQQPIRSQGSAEQVFADLCHAIEEAGARRAGGIGIGVPSLVNSKNGTIFDTTNIPSWQAVPLKKKLEKKFGLPVRIDNDANCFALGESHFGQGKNCENFVGLILGTGMGAGIISRGHLHSGTDGGAGEFGMISYREANLEAYCSGQFFRRHGREGAEVSAAAAAGEVNAKELFFEYGKHLAEAFQIILYSLAPEMIILGGSVSLAYPHFRAALEKSLEEKFVYPSVRKALRVKVSRKPQIAVLGAASLLRDL
ncbi:MAG: ROK family protein [Bacteriovoracia bacterium]